MRNYIGMTISAQIKQEKFDCCVKALALVLDIPYEEAHTVCKMHGRENRKRMLNKDFMRAINGCGIRYKQMEPRQRNGSRYTGVTIHKKLEAGKRYMVWYDRHVAAFIDGKLEDWTHGNRHRVLGVWEITKLPEAS